MTGNPLLWILISAAVGYTLYAKGYLKTPAAKAPRTTSGGPSAHELGILFALAQRKEAEDELASYFATTAAEALKASFKAPFSPAPAPEGAPDVKK